MLYLHYFGYNFLIFPGEKIGMGITILLAFSVFQLLIASEIPKTSESTPMLGE